MITELQQQTTSDTQKLVLVATSIVTILIVIVTLSQTPIAHFLFYGYVLISTLVTSILIIYIGLASKHIKAFTTGILMCGLMLIVQYSISYQLYQLLF